MIASRESWRFAWLAAAIAAGLVIAFARGAATTVSAPTIELPPASEHIDDGLRGATPRIELDLGGGVLEDTPVDQPRRDRGY